MINTQQYEALTSGARTVKGWASRFRLPKALTQALEVWDAVEAYRVETMVPDLSALTSETIGDVHEALTATLVAAGRFTQTVRSGADPNLSYAEVAHQVLKEHAARTVVQLANPAAPSVLEQHQPHFAKAAAAYAAAVQALGVSPKDLCWATLGKRGRTVAFEAVRAAYSGIESASALVHEAGNLGAHPTRGQREEVTHLVTPDAGEFLKIDASIREQAAWRQQDHDHLFGPAGGPLYLAAQLGVPFEMRSLTSARSLRSSLEAQVSAELPRQIRVWSPNGSVAAVAR